MKMTVIAVCLATAVGMGSIQAATVVGNSYGAIGVDAPNHSREVAILKEAYDTLEKADHDYKGHRREAMNHIEKACDFLGYPIKGDGRAHQTQAVSDGELREAQQKVQAVRSHVAGSQPQVAAQLDAAIKQIGVALTIK